MVIMVSHQHRVSWSNDGKIGDNIVKFIYLFLDNKRRDMKESRDTKLTQKEKQLLTEIE